MGELERWRARRAVGLDKCEHIVALGHRASAYLHAAKSGASVGKKSHLLQVPPLQEPVGEAAHECVASPGGIYRLHFEAGDMNGFLARSDQTTFRAHRDGDKLGSEIEELARHLVEIALAGHFLGGCFAGFENVNEFQSCDKFFLLSQGGLCEEAGGEGEIENNPHVSLFSGCTR